MAAKADPILTPPCPTTNSAHHITPTRRVDDRLRFSAKASRAHSLSPPSRLWPSEPSGPDWPADRNLSKSGSGWTFLISSQSPHATLHWRATSLLLPRMARGSGARKKVLERLSLAHAQVDSLLLLFCCFCWPDLLYTPPCCLFCYCIIVPTSLSRVRGRGTEDRLVAVFMGLWQDVTKHIPPFWTWF